jgi:hypothetical protein
LSITASFLVATCQDAHGRGRLAVLYIGSDPGIQTLAVRALIVSFVPDIAVAFWPRAKWPYAFALAAMHIAAWAVCVPMLTKLTTKDAKRREIGGEG